MGCGTSFVKYVLFFFNLLFALVGLAMLGLGVAVLLKWTLISDLLKNHMQVAPWLFIIIGAVIFIIAFFGCCGAIRESHCMIVTYAIFLLVIIIVQVILAILIFTYSSNIKDTLSKTVTSMYDQSKVDKATEEVFHNIEIQLECCGNRGPSDYRSFANPESLLILPKSCCTRGVGVVGRVLADHCTVDAANDAGCNQKVTDIYEKWDKPIAGVAIGVACVEVIGAIFALCLANSIRNMDRRSRY